MTKFKPVPSQVDFPAMEREILAWWYESGLVAKYLHKNDGAKKKFRFLDGPITANNPMGVHHAWGRTYKDLWQRYHTMLGDKQRYQNGFDCQGLWVEVEVEKELGFKLKKDIEAYGVAEFVNRCKERVLKYSTIQTEQSKRLGYFMDWENSYFTMSDENNYTIWHFLKVCWERGWIYKGHDSVPWCPRCETAISQHEMLTEDYRELTHETVFFKLPVKYQDISLVAWTTTPWTIPANVALAVNPKFSYQVWENTETGEKIVTLRTKDSDNRLISIDGYDEYQNLIERIFEGQKDKWEEKEILLGSDLVGLVYEGPFDGLVRVQRAREEKPEKFHKVVAAEDLVVATKGTGILHIAPGAGEEDFRLGKELDLPVINVIADNADYLDSLGELSGKNAKLHPEIIINYLKDYQGGKFIFKTAPISHRYPVCWRCKTELVWKVADVWYIAMDRKDPTDNKKRTLRGELKDLAPKIRWLPEFGLDRELDWLSNMHDWLISKKNRYWGLALPIYECAKCGHFEVIGSKEELKRRAVVGWEKFEGSSPHRPWIDEVKIKCPNCSAVASRILDVGNPWLDAGIVSFSTLHYLEDKTYWQEWFPADFITESFPGQFKNWFYSLLVMSTVLQKSNPFQTVLGFGTLLGEDGRPMHKSWGNAVEFNEGADKIGVDVMRWMYARQNPSDNMLFGYKKADEVRRQFFLTLWNVYSFFVTYAKIDSWTPGAKNKGLMTSKNILDQWILARLDEVIKIVTEGLDKYDAMNGALAIEAFVQDLSTWYIRRSRDRVGPTADDKEEKEAFYNTCWHVLVTLSKLLAPFTPFIAEEMYKNLTGNESVHLESWPSGVGPSKQQTVLISEMRLVREVVEKMHALRKQSSIKVRQPLRGLYFYGNVDKNIWWKDYETLLKEELNVKEIGVRPGASPTMIPYTLDTNVDSSLQKEGTSREIVRQIQDARKAAGTGLDEKIIVVLPDWPNEYGEYIKKQTLATEIKRGDKLEIKRTK